MRPHSIALILLACSLPAPCTWAQADAQPDSVTGGAWVLFPTARLFPHMYASELTHDFGVSKETASAILHGSIGNERPLVQASLGSTTLQLGAGATVHTSMIKRPRLLQVITADFLVEFPVDIRISERVSIRTGWGHFSAHLADDGIEILHLSSLNYAKDYLVLLGAWRAPYIMGVLYGGGHYDYHSLPEADRHWTLQCGYESAALRLFPEVFFYAALDIRCMSEVAWATTQEYQAGLKFFPRGAQALRLALSYRTGMDARGQFYRDRLETGLLGLFLDF